MERNSNPLEDYKAFMTEAIKVGRRVYPTDGIVTKIQNSLETYKNNPKYLFSAIEGALTDEIYRVQENLEDLRKPKKLATKEKLKLALSRKKPEKPDEKTELNKQVPDLTKLAYLSAVMLETMANRMKCCGGNLPGEIVFFKSEYPSIINYINEVVRKETVFDLGVINEISRISNKKTFEWLKNRWTKEEEQRPSY